MRDDDQYTCDKLAQSWLQQIGTVFGQNKVIKNMYIPGNNNGCYFNRNKLKELKSHKMIQDNILRINWKMTIKYCYSIVTVGFKIKKQ